MRYAAIRHTLSSEPMLITPDYRNALLEILDQHVALTRAEFRAAREGSTRSGDAVDLDQMEIVDGIAWIPVGGPIGYRLGKFEKGAGAVDVADITTDIDEAESSDEVSALVLDMDTPGGMVSGIPELADRIRACDKPICAWSGGGMIASAGYWLASACDGVFVTKSADVGSIGVYAPFTDLSKMAEMQGIKVKVFSSGKYKGMGVPGTEMTLDQQNFMQARVMEIAAAFYNHVRAMRTDVQDEDMQGQIFKADSALARGLVDGIMATKDDLVAFLS